MRGKVVEKFDEKVQDLNMLLEDYLVVLVGLDLLIRTLTSCLAQENALAMNNLRLIIGHMVARIWTKHD